MTSQLKGIEVHYPGEADTPDGFYPPDYELIAETDIFAEPHQAVAIIKITKPCTLVLYGWETSYLYKVIKEEIST